MADALYRQLHEQLAAYGQEHVLRWWPELNEAQRAELAVQIQSLDLAELHRLFHQHHFGAARPVVDWHEVEPPEILRSPETFAAWEREQQAVAVGERALRSGQVAIAMVAGGQGSRLGHNSPKGAYPIGPITQRSLFQLHAEKILALSRRYEVALPWYVMTSPDNDAATRQFFARHNYFGLAADQITFFVQGTMPALEKDTGRLLMCSKWQLALSPNGHGGFLTALQEAGILEDWQRRGVRWLFYFQVDNPLVKIADPLFLGQHITRRAEVSVKVVRRRHAEEKLGQVVRYRGCYYLVEYSEIPVEYQKRIDSAGRFWLDAGNIAVHVFDVAFLQRIIAQASDALPYHRAVKKVPYVDETGAYIEPSTPNAVKWERFIFDVFPLAQRVLVVEVNRAEEFEPLKNASGENSPETVRAALSELYARWLEQAGVAVPRDSLGRVSVPIEISPLVALDAGDLRGQVEHLAEIRGPLLLSPPDRQAITCSH